MRGLVDDRNAVDAVYLYFSKAFDSLSRNILIARLMKHRPGNRPMRCAEKWLNCWAQRVVISITKSSRRPVSSGVPQ